MQNMVSIWKSRGMSLGLKVRFLRATAFPIAIYGCESWAMTSGDKKRVDSFEMWCYRRLLRVSWTERKTNKWVLEKIGSVLMLRKSMSERKMRFFGHIVQKNGMEKRQKARKDGRQAEKGQTSNDLVPGFERVDQAGHCWCITTGDRSGKMAKNHQSHSSEDSAT